MPLETGDFICDLVETNPPGTDPVSQGDDHLRLIKHVLVTQFPNLCGEAVTATAEDLNNAGASRMPIVTTYSTPAAAQTHTFTPGRAWFKVIVTGGGGGGYNSSAGCGGNAGGTAIKTAAITELTATFTVGAGGVVQGDAEDSSFVQGADDIITGQGGTAGQLAEATSVSIANGLNGDVNLKGGTGARGNSSYVANGQPGVSYWGGGSSYVGSTEDGAYGTGGHGTASSAARAGNSGVIVIEEY